jgi:hypothetical protein
LAVRPEEDEFVNINEAKTVLLLYRPGTADAEDPQIAAALELAKREPELARWLEEHCERQEVLRAKFRQIEAPAGLKEQIISEQAARERSRYRRPLAAVAALALLVFLTLFWVQRPPADNTLAVYQNQMAGTALRGYAMDLTTNDPAQIRAYLARNRAPSDYVLPAALQKAAVIGCAIEGWQNVKVSMICFRTGRPLTPNQASDLWLFVVEDAALKDAPQSDQPRLATVNRLRTAVWARGGTVYLLGTDGDEATIRKFL